MRTIGIPPSVLSSRLVPLIGKTLASEIYFGTRRSCYLSVSLCTVNPSNFYASHASSHAANQACGRFMETLFLASESYPLNDGVTWACTPAKLVSSRRPPNSTGCRPGSESRRRKTSTPTSDTSRCSASSTATTLLCLVCRRTGGRRSYFRGSFALILLCVCF